MEDMAAVCEPLDLVLRLELTEADGAALHRQLQLRELHHRQGFSDEQQGINWLKFRHTLRKGEAGIYTRIKEEDGNEFFDER